MRIVKLALVIMACVAPDSIAPAAGAAATLEKYYGVWIGRGVAVEEHGNRTLQAKRNFDVAIWGIETGFVISWRNLSSPDAGRTTVRFAAAGEPETFEAKSTDPPLCAGQIYRAEIRADRLIVYRSDANDERRTSYEYSLLGRGLKLKYTLSSGGELKESSTSRFYKAKVVM
ncbi:MAG: hypothetical protein ACR2RB_02595 [Gammaproteobacteria bacterium]